LFEQLLLIILFHQGTTLALAQVTEQFLHSHGTLAFCHYLPCLYFIYIYIGSMSGMRGFFIFIAG